MVWRGWDLVGPLQGAYQLLRFMNQGGQAARADQVLLAGIVRWDEGDLHLRTATVYAIHLRFTFAHI